jgi:hypothetical protein
MWQTSVPGSGRTHAPRQICFDIVDVLKPDGNTQQAFADPRLRPCLG